MSKALELPVNVLVIIAVAVIALLAVIVLFYSGYSSSQKITLDAAKSQACHQWIESGCSITSSDILIKNFDVDSDGNINTDSNPFSDVGDNLTELGSKYYQTSSEANLKDLCGCTASSWGGGGGGGGGCTPLTCADYPGQCGSLSDGCGGSGTITCTCSSGFCSGGVCVPCNCFLNPKFQCGNGCLFIGIFPAWWKKCQCIPPGCGLATGTTCPDGSPENTQTCTVVTC